MKKLLLVIFALAIALIAFAEVRFGERPFIDIFKVPDSAIEKGHIRIKLNEKYSEHTAALTRIDGAVMKFEIKDLDALNKKYGVSKITQVFGDPAKNKKYGWRHIEWGLHLWFDLQFDSQKDIRDIVMAYRDLKNSVQWAEPEYTKTLLSINQDEVAGIYENLSRWTPNDPRYAEQWDYNNTGQTSGTVDADIDLPEAWEIEKGHPDVIVQVNDGGIQTNHPDLSGNLWINPGEIAGNGIDDDANGYIDDIYGYNFVSDIGEIYPHQHGTHVAGTIAARSNNGTGVAGIAGGNGSIPGVKLMSTQVYELFYSGGWAPAIAYAADNGAAISQNSWGHVDPDIYEQPVLDAIDYFNANGGGTVMDGGISIFSAGNENSNGLFYPGCYSGTFAVSAINHENKKAWYSNFGTVIDVSAPGGEKTNHEYVEGVLSTDIGSGYTFLEGTSMACPHVSGVAALVLSYAHRNAITLTNTQLANILRNTTDNIDAANPGFIGQLGTGRINAYSAVLAADLTRPICSITSPGSGEVFALGSSITVNVSATDSDGSITGVAFYLDGALKFTDTITPYSWVWNSSGEAHGNHIIKVLATDNSAKTVDRAITITLLAPADEGFEAGHFLLHPWVNNSLIPWTIQTSEVFAGSYAAKSGYIGYSGSTTLSYPVEVSTAGNISFYYKVSSDSDHDYLKFYIDAVQQNQWSGVMGWSGVSYPVTVGLHTFTWTYSKNGDRDYGSDCAWLDHIVFPPLAPYYAPPQNLAAIGGDGIVSLSWQAPAIGIPTAYKIYRDAAFLTTVTGLNHSDTSVANNTTYSYYVTAVYAGGESGPSQSVSAYPTNLFTIPIMIGNGTNTQEYPINRNNTHSSYESIYLASQIGQACLIKSVGFNKANGTDLTPIGAVSIYLKHTSESALATGTYSLTGYTLVYSGNFPNTATTGWMEVQLDNFFDYNGSSNLAMLIIKGQQATVSSNNQTWSYSDTANYQARGASNHSSQPSNLTSSKRLPNLKIQAYVAVGIYYPALNLSAIGGNTLIKLAWLAPLAGTPTGYKIYRNASLLTTVTSLTYTDYAVVNETSYSYYVVASYFSDDAAATDTVYAIPILVSSAIIGEGTSSNGTDQACPINISIRSLHGQAVYTAAELNAKGVFGPIDITKIGFNVTDISRYAMPNYVIRMKHTSATNVATWVNNTNLATVWSTTSYQPVITGWNMFTMQTPFTWNGTDNLLIDTAFSLAASWAYNGTTQCSTVINGYRFTRNDYSNQTDVFTGGSISYNRPNLRLVIDVGQELEPQIEVSPSSLSFGVVDVGSSSVQQFSIQNIGTEPQIGYISTPDGYTVGELSEPRVLAAGTKSSQKLSSARAETRNSLGFDIPIGETRIFNLSFDPTAPGFFNGNVVINIEGDEVGTIAISGEANIPEVYPIVLPFFEGWDMGNFETNNWTIDSSNWGVESGEIASKDPAPYAYFSWYPEISNYSSALTSNDLDATGMSSVYFNFDLFLDNYTTSAENVMTWEIWDGMSWFALGSYTSLDESLNWTAYSYDVSAYASNRLFKIRFVASGEDSYQINGWNIDNISLSDSNAGIDPVTDLSIERFYAGVYLDWTGVTGAIWYIIYASEEPYGSFDPLGYVEYSDVSLPEYLLPEDKAFFKVSAGSGAPPDLPNLSAPATKKSKKINP